MYIRTYVRIAHIHTYVNVCMIECVHPNVIISQPYSNSPRLQCNADILLNPPPVKPRPAIVSLYSPWHSMYTRMYLRECRHVVMCLCTYVRSSVHAYVCLYT